MPSREVVREIRQRLRIASDWEYFFSNLDDGSWVEPLVQEGFFSKPPGLQRSGQYIRFPRWPASRFLVRMAPLNPQGVLKAIRAVPDTDNVSVLEDLVEAASLLPADLAARLAANVQRWVAGEFHLLMPEKAAAYVQTLAAAGKQPALKVAAKLFAVFPDPSAEDSEFARPSQEPERVPDKDDVDAVPSLPTWNPRPRPRSYMDLWLYGHTLEKLVAPLTEAFGLPTLNLFVKLLRESLTFSRRASDDGDPEAISYVWRRTIEPDEDNFPDTVTHLLIDAVRDCATALVKTGPASVAEVVSALHGGVVLDRIALHILATSPVPDNASITRALADPQTAWSFAARHEAIRLVSVRYGGLTAKQRAGFLKALEDGPGSIWASRTEERAHYEDKGRRDWLHLIEPDLSTPWRRRYQRLVRKYGEAHPMRDPVGPTESWVGPTSPMRADEIGGMDPSAVARYFKDWEPLVGWKAHSREGLARAFTEVVAARPARFVDVIDLFKDQRPVFVDALLEGLTRRKDAESKLDWSAILDFCDWVLKQRDSQLGPPGDWEESFAHSWKHPRRNVARLLSSGLSGRSVIARSQRRRVWRQLALLLEDEDPSPPDESSDSMGPATLAINSVRGEAMHATMRYIMWLVWDRGGKRRTASMDETAEWKAALVSRLDPQVDPSAAVRSVYGVWLPKLIALDEDWVRSIRRLIFPRVKRMRYLYDAAWESYLTFGSNVYWRPYVVLRTEYATAISELSQREDAKDLPIADARLAQHIIQLYCSGWLGARIDRGPVRQLFDASARAAAHALWLVGRDVKTTPTVWGQDAITRLRRIWEWRLREAEQAPSPRSAIELPSFGWWYASTAFRRDFAVRQLLRGLRLVPKVEGDRDVIQTLAQDVSSYPAEVVEAARLLAEGDSEGWHISSWKSELLRIIRAGLAGRGTARAASELANYLAARGERGYEDVGP